MPEAPALPPGEEPPRPRLYSGAGSRFSAAPLAARLSGGKGAILLVTGSSSLSASGLLAPLVDSFQSAGLSLSLRSVRGEPDCSLVDSLADEARSASCLVAIGGGSAMDAAKAAAALATVEGGAADYLEGVGTLVHPGSSLPLIAIPTTAGTGAEATTNAVLSGLGAGGKPFKRSLRHPGFLPRAAILDPELCIGQAGPGARARAMDALSQLLEAATSRKAGPLSDAVVFTGLELLGRALPRLYAGGDDASLWMDLLLAAHCSGIGLSSAGLGLPHGIAGVLGAATGLGHGEILARVLAPSFGEALRFCRAAEGEESRAFLNRASRAASCLAAGNSGPDAPERLCALLEEWRAGCELPGLSARGVGPEVIAAVAAGASCRESLARTGPPETAAVLRACR